MENWIRICINTKRIFIFVSELVVGIKWVLPSFFDFPIGFKLVLPLSFQLFSSLFLLSIFSAPLKVFEGVELPFPGVY